MSPWASRSAVGGVAGRRVHQETLSMVRVSLRPTKLFIFRIGQGCLENFSVKDRIMTLFIGWLPQVIVLTKYAFKLSRHYSVEENNTTKE